MRIGWLALLLAACGGDPPAPAAPGPAAAPRHVILISVDTLRADRLGAYGYPRATSPRLDELAAEGVLFERASSPAPWTLPAHGALLTARHPSQFDLGPWTRPGRIPEQVLTLAEVLQQAGYQCQAVTDGGFLSAKFGFDQGFEGYQEKNGSFQAPDPDGQVAPPPPGSDDLVFRARDMVDGALAFLDDRDAARPFFLFLHTYSVHDYNPPAEDREALVRPYSGRLAERQGVADFLQSRKYQDLVRELDADDRRYVGDLYDAAVRAMDRQLGRLLGELERRRLRHDTLVVVTSDHGEELFDHDGSGHGYTMYQENLEVPLVFAHRSLPAARVARPARLQDVAPTILELVGVAAPAEWKGASLVPAFTGGGEDRPSFAAHAHVPLRAVVQDSWKFIRGDRRDDVQLYDLSRDPGEQNDLAGQGHPQEQELRRALNLWRRTMDELRLRGEEADLDAALQQQLERLGYADDVEEDAEDETTGDGDPTSGG